MAGTSLGNSLLTDNGTTLSYNGNFNMTTAGQGTQSFTTSGNAGPYIAYNLTALNNYGGTIANSGITGLTVTATEGAGGDDDAVAGDFIAVGSATGSPSAIAGRFNASGCRWR